MTMQVSQSYSVQCIEQFRLQIGRNQLFSTKELQTAAHYGTQSQHQAGEESVETKTDIKHLQGSYVQIHSSNTRSAECIKHVHQGNYFKWNTLR